MAGDESTLKAAEVVGDELNGMKLDEEFFTSSPPAVEEGAPSTDHTTTPMSTGINSSKSKTTATPPDMMDSSAAPTPKSEDGAIDGEVVVSSDIIVQVEPGKAPKLSRKASAKIIPIPPPLFAHLPDATEESKTHFTAIPECVYASKLMGASEHDTLGCDCSPEYKKGINHACGEDSDCINRATKMECTDDECNCGANCQNQRFQRRQYAQVSVIKTEKKGFGLRADTDLQPDDFIFEYIGEVIGEPIFRKRTKQYNDEGIKHFYFMSLTKHEFVDATKKGNLGRFCNHSCNPNCYVDKWVVGDKLRMGIFAERPIKAGEELVFNYNVDRYGADPQPCYCGEANCTGFIGGKTQTEQATKLSNAVIEALGIEDGDGWNIAVPKKSRKKKQGEDDEEYVSNVQPKGLDHHGVTKVMATLMQCKEKWVAVKLLGRVQRCNDERVRSRVVRMHGYQILRTTMTAWKDDNNVVLQVLDILYKLPRLTRNKIVDSKIETAVSLFVESEHEDIAKESKRLLDEWGKLDLGYRIPRKKFDPNEQALGAFERSRRESDSKKDEEEKAFVAPSGPRSSMPQRNLSFYRPPPPRPRNTLPSGWFAALDPSGKTYYYSKAGQTTWQRPNQPAPDAPPPPPPTAPGRATQKALQSILDGITKVESPSKTASPALKELSKYSNDKPKKPKEEWRSWPIEKQKKLYENTIAKYVRPIMNTFSKKLSKDDCKKFAKEVSKKLVDSDFKNNSVVDPNKVPDKNIPKIEKYVKDFFGKAVIKKAQIDARRAEKKARTIANGSTSTNSLVPKNFDKSRSSKSGRSEEMDMEMSDDEEPTGGIISMSATPATPVVATPDHEGIKRKRSDEDFDDQTPSSNPFKRHKESPEEPPPPPPPPPPGADVMLTQEQVAEDELMRESEEALMKENEDAMGLEDDNNESMHWNGDRHNNHTSNGGKYQSAHDEYLASLASQGQLAHPQPIRPSSRYGQEDQAPQAFSRPNSAQGQQGFARQPPSRPTSGYGQQDQSQHDQAYPPPSRPTSSHKDSYDWDRIGQQEWAPANDSYRPSSQNGPSSRPPSRGAGESAPLVKSKKHRIRNRHKNKKSRQASSDDPNHQPIGGVQREDTMNGSHPENSTNGNHPEASNSRQSSIDDTTMDGLHPERRRQLQR